jgi:F-type H+-transporting ATPase subunit epsilon
MRLVVTMPTAIVVDQDRVYYVRAEDASGSFGIEPGHADLLTSLCICVVRWRNDAGRGGYVAVRGGILRVRDGKLLEIATREAVVGNDLARLREEVLSAMRSNLEAEQSARAGAFKLENALVRQIYRYLRPTDQPARTKPQRIVADVAD